MEKQAVISGYYGFGNFGDEAILAVLVKKLKELDYRPVVLSSNPQKTSMELYVNAINSFNFHQVSGLIKQSDVLISGGGSLLQDVTSIKSLIYYLWVIFTALRYKKKVIIFAQGIGPIKNKFAQIITAKLLKKCCYVSVRDYKSHQLLKKWGVYSDLLCDPIFSLEIPKEKQSGTIGIQLRSFSSLKENLLNKLARQIVKDFNNKKIEIYSLQDSLDLEICQKFQQMLKNINPDIKTEVISGISNSEIIQRISKLEILVAMRFHALIIAMKTGVKPVAINYDIKVEKLAQEAEIPIISMNGEEDFDEIFNSLKSLNENKINEFVKSQSFNWTNFEDAVKNN